MFFLPMDLVRALRALRRSPLFAAVAVLSIGLGVGGSTAVFSWMDSLVLHPFPAVSEPGRLAGLEMTRNDGGDGGPLSFPAYRDWRAASRSFSGVAGWSLARVSAREGRADGSLPRLAMTVSGNYFDVTGVRPAIGRLLTRADEHEVAPVAVITYPYWQRVFAGDPAVVGRPLVLNGEPVTIVGVAPERFAGTYVGVVPDMFVPITLAPRFGGAASLEDRGARWVQSFARLAPGVTVARAGRELDALARRVSAEHGERPVTGALVKEARMQYLGGIVFPLFSALLAITALLLLLACANLASMLLVRADARRGEIALRLALGATRSRVAGSAIAETAVLATAGGTLGVLVAQLGRGVLARLIPSGPYPVTLPIAFNARVLLVALAASCLVALLCGLGPVLHLSRVAPAASLELASRTATRSGSRLRLALVAGQVALSLLCLATAALFVRGLRAASRVDLGFTDPGTVLLVNTDLTPARLRDSAGATAVRRLLAEVRALPGVRAATVSTMVPLGFGARRTAELRVEGYVPAPDESMTAERASVGPDYARTMGIAVVEGRDVADGDRAGTLPVALVNETLARRYWGAAAAAIGRRLDAGHGWATVVGVVRDGKYGTLTESPRAVAYFAIAQWTQSAMTVHVRMAGDPLALAEPVRAALRRVHGDLPALQPRSLAEHIAAATFVQRVGASVLGAFGLAALALAALGVYGALAFAVAAGRRELAIRLALGATAGTIAWRVLRLAAVVAASGLAAGAVLAAMVGRLLRGALATVGPADPSGLAAAAGLLVATVALAACVPARRALRADPAAVLRGE
ncbi:MAG TPA: ADOP family duplicated permease [Gemmatimonadaceae bacterium]|nr:ADOP family duplicated permease [Gemmatimonadaceae bacterium]